MDNVVTGVLAFEGDGVVREYVGGYSDWVRQGGKLPPAPWEGAARQQVEPVATPDTPKKEAAMQAATPAKKPLKLSYKLQRELDALPAMIEKLETEVAEFEAQVGDSAFYQQESEAIAEALQAMGDKQAELDAAMERWMELEALAAGE